MATKIKTWEIIDGQLKAIESTLADEGRTESLDLETWITTNPEIIGPSLEIIGRQVTTKSGPLDLLAIDRLGNTIVIELKRDMLPRLALAQAIDYVSDIAEWNIDKFSEICTKYSGKSLEDFFNEKFPDTNLENINVNETQRIILVGFAIESALERMINWLSEKYGVNINAIILEYTRTISGDELLTRTAIISEELEQSRTSKKKFTIPMSDDIGEYGEEKLEQLLINYLSQEMWSARRIRKVLLPVCLEEGLVLREEIKQKFVEYGEADSESNAGYFLSLISQQIGMSKNDFLRQVIGYDYPNHPWEKDRYHIREGYHELVRRILREIKENENIN